MSDPENKRYEVIWDGCRVTWIVDAPSPQAAEDRAWDRYEEGREPDVIDCDAPRTRVREAPRTTLTDLINMPHDDPGETP